MYLAIPSDVYARAYGEDVYLFNQTTWASVFVKNAKVFLNVFSRRPIRYDRVIKEVSDACKQSASVIRSDLMELIKPLIADGFLLCGKTVDLDLPSISTFSRQHSTTCKAPRLLNGNNDKTSAESKENALSVAAPEDCLFEYFRNVPTPFELDVDLTNACTEKCIHCYVSDFGACSLGLDLIKKVFGEFREKGGLKVKLTGGECMLHRDFEKILQIARAHDFVISVLSNLTQCTSSHIDAMAEANVAVVQASLYGADSMTHDTITRLEGSFEQTKKGIMTLLNRGIQVQIHCPVMKQNIHSIEAIKELGQRLGVKTTFDAAIMTRADHAKSNLDCLLSDVALHQFLAREETEQSEFVGNICVAAESPICNIGLARICLSATGDYYPCSGCCEYILGNCRQMTLAEIWHSKRMEALRSIRFKDMSKCQKCKFIFYCKICPARNYNSTRSLFDPDKVLCRISRTKYDIARERRLRDAGKTV